VRKILGALLMASSSIAFSSEPVKVEAVMQGFPPSHELRVSRENFMLPPFNRWAFQHIRELQPTREVYRGNGAVTDLEEAAVELADRSYTVTDERKITLGEWLQESATDAFLVLHEGHIVYERYLNGQQEQTQHQMFSATKSFIGTLVLMLVEEGKIEPSRTVQSYVPEMKGSAFGGATVQQVLDMTTSIEFSEAYTDPKADIWAYGSVFGLAQVDEASMHFDSIYDYLPTLGSMKTLKHGQAFHYVTPNTDALG
jgi:CubicO group peptidase (beta-lactamase class C family)